MNYIDTVSVGLGAAIVVTAVVIVFLLKSAAPGVQQKKKRLYEQALTADEQHRKSLHGDGCELTVSSLLSVDVLVHKGVQVLDKKTFLIGQYIGLLVGRNNCFSLLVAVSPKG